MTDIKTLEEILEKAHQKLLFGWIKNDGKTHAIPTHVNNDGCMDEAKQVLNLYIEERERLARIEVLKYSRDLAKANHSNLSTVFEDRIKELEG